MYILSIYTDRQSCYNIATVGGEAKIIMTPREANMAVSKAQQKAVNKYMSVNYDRVNLTMPKGQKDRVKAHAEARGESVNAFINRAIDETMERDGA